MPLTEGAVPRILQNSMSEYIEIKGGVPLQGTVQVSGAKNAALPLLIATLLTPELCSFTNIPGLEDVSLTLSLLEHLGAEVQRSDDQVKVSVPKLVATEASYSLVKALRASFWVLAPLIARGGAARVALPGGDLIGARPVDIHLQALSEMGADITVKHGVVMAVAKSGLRPALINFRFPSVGATHQILMAAALVQGTTVIEGAAREPEVVALAQMLVQMGANIEGAGTSRIVINGVERLKGATVAMIGDRIEAATYLLASVATGGSVTVKGINPAHLGAFLPALHHMGVNVREAPNEVSVSSAGRLKPANLSTGPFPEFATDIQAQLMAALSVAEGESKIEETIFEGRFGHVSELCRMGANIIVQDRTATITGVAQLSGAPVEAHDIRAGAALVIAGLVAQGTTLIGEPQHLRRGYARLEQQLRSLGASVGRRLSDPDDFVFTGC